MQNTGWFKSTFVTPLSIFFSVGVYGAHIEKTQVKRTVILGERRIRVGLIDWTYQSDHKYRTFPKENARCVNFPS